MALQGRGATLAATADAGACHLCCFPWGTGVGCEVPLGGGVRCALFRACGYGGMSSHGSCRFGCTLPPGFQVGAQSLLRHQGSATWLGRVRGTEARAVAAGELPKQPPRVFFNFFFLKNSSCSSLMLHIRAWPLSQPSSPTRPGTDWARAHQAQLSPPSIHSFHG